MLFSVLRNEEAYAVQLKRVLPLHSGSWLHTQFGIRACAINAAERHLPLVDVEDAILLEVKCVEEILDDLVAGCLLISELVHLRH